MGCLGSFSSNFLKILHFLIFGSGVLMLGLGVWLCIDNTSFTNELAKVDILKESIKLPKEAAALKGISFGFIAVGGIIMALSVFGLCASCSNGTCCLALYAIALFFILAVEIGGAVFIHKNKDLAEKFFLKQITLGFDEYQKLGLKLTSEGNDPFDLFMIELQCCGINNSSDFKNNPLYNTTDGLRIPKACCKKNIKIDSSGCPNKPKAEDSNMNIGCYPLLKYKVIKYIDCVKYFMGGIIAVEVLIFILTIFAILGN